MASSTPTICPHCGGRAHFHSDDGITYCDELKCKKWSIEGAHSDYKPPEYRGVK